MYYYPILLQVPLMFYLKYIFLKTGLQRIPLYPAYTSKLYFQAEAEYFRNHFLILTWFFFFFLFFLLPFYNVYHFILLIHQNYIFKQKRNIFGTTFYY